MGGQVYRRLLGAGVDTIIDDRPVRAGVKFSDVELAGIPFRVIIGRRGLAAGNAEVSDRASGEAAAVALDEIAGDVRKTVAHAVAGQP
jgi:prolyl-tRNA synthetase